MKIYLAHQISGLSYDEVHDYYTRMAIDLQDNYEVLSPMTAKGYLRTETELLPGGYSNPVSTNHAIAERDLWMVRQADVVFVNLLGMTRVSIGCTMELAWAHLLRKHTVVAMEKDNPHRHAFVLEAADIVFVTMEDAMDYLRKLPQGGW